MPWTEPITTKAATESPTSRSGGDGSYSHPKVRAKIGAPNIYLDLISHGILFEKQVPYSKHSTNDLSSNQTKMGMPRLWLKEGRQNHCGTVVKQEREVLRCQQIVGPNAAPCIKEGRVGAA